jgi:predicted Zn-dependent protease with MMP-like domain
MAARMDRQDPLGPAPDAATIEGIARATIDRLPAAFAQHLHGIVLLVEEVADDETLAALGIEHPLDLTGLYSGLPVGQKAGSEAVAMPDRIHLYRRAILDEWVETGVRLDDLVAHVTIHEIGHHFGLSDADMHALEDQVADDPD